MFCLIHFILAKKWGGLKPPQPLPLRGPCNIYVRFGSSVFGQVIGIPMGTNSAPLSADLFLHTFEYDFMVKTMKQDITKVIQFSNTFRRLIQY